MLAQALAWLAGGRKVALATVARTWGSSPRPAGSKLAVDDAAEFVGSVSGGCIEGAVIQEALEVMAVGGSRVLVEAVVPASSTRACSSAGHAIACLAPSYR